MKRTISLLLAAVMSLLLFAGCGSSNTTAPETTGSESEGTETYEKMRIKVSYTMGDNAIDGLVAAYMKEELEKRSNGAITLELYGNAQLASGDQNRQIEMAIAGDTFDMGILAEMLFAPIDRRFNVTNIPFAFSGYEEAYEYADSTGGEWSKKAMEENGIKLLGTFSNGIFQLSNDVRPIHTPADMAGLKLRAIGDLNIKEVVAMGADAVNINFSELYSALQTGACDGQMNGWLTIHDASIQEVQQYMTQLNANWLPFHIVCNLKAWNNYSEANRQLIEEVAKEAALYGREYMYTAEENAKQSFLDSGVEIYVPTEDELEQWRAAVKPVIDEYVEVCGEEACRAWGIID